MPPPEWARWPPSSGRGTRWRGPSSEPWRWESVRRPRPIRRAGTPGPRRRDSSRSSARTAASRRPPGRASWGGRGIAWAGTSRAWARRSRDRRRWRPCWRRSPRARETSARGSWPRWRPATGRRPAAAPWRRGRGSRRRRSSSCAREADRWANPIACRTSESTRPSIRSRRFGRPIRDTRRPTWPRRTFALATRRSGGATTRGPRGSTGKRRRGSDRPWRGRPRTRTPSTNWRGFSPCTARRAPIPRIAARGDDPNLWDTLAEAAYRAGALDRAIEAAERAARMDKESARYAERLRAFRAAKEALQGTEKSGSEKGRPSR